MPTPCIGFLRDEPGAEVVEELFNDALQKNHALLMSVINWGEVYYTIARHEGYKKADAAMRAAENSPIVVVEVDMAQAEAAGRIRAGYGLPYADCFAAVLAGKDGVVVTSDVRDFQEGTVGEDAAASGPECLAGLKRMAQARVIRGPGVSLT